jgi:hypothetical protein
MQFSIEIERETDGRWIAEIPSLPGVLASFRRPHLAVGHSAFRRAVQARAGHLQVTETTREACSRWVFPEFTNSVTDIL